MALLVRSVVRVPEASPAGVSRAARGLRRRHTRARRSGMLLVFDVCL